MRQLAQTSAFLLSCTTSRLPACLRTERQDKATPAVLMANTFYANAVRSRCCSAGKIATKQCRCAAFQERLPCSHCPMHVLHAAVAGACEEQEEYLRESRHVCAPERSQTRPHTDTEHPTQPGVVDGVTGRPPRHVQRALGQHAFCPRLPTEVALDTCTSNRHAVSSTSQPSRTHVGTAPWVRLATAISSGSICIRSRRNEGGVSKSCTVVKTA